MPGPIAGVPFLGCCGANLDPRCKYAAVIVTQDTSLTPILQNIFSIALTELSGLAYPTNNGERRTRIIRSYDASVFATITQLIGQSDPGNASVFSGLLSSTAWGETVYRPPNFLLYGGACYLFNRKETAENSFPASWIVQKAILTGTPGPSVCIQERNALGDSCYAQSSAIELMPRPEYTIGPAPTLSATYISAVFPGWTVGINACCTP